MRQKKLKKHFNPESIQPECCQRFAVKGLQNLFTNFRRIILISKYFKKGPFPVDIYLFKVNNRNSRTRCEIYTKLTIKTTYFTPCSSVSIVDFEQVNADWVTAFIN